MRNSTFFKEAAIIANYALNHKNPLTDGIEYGIKALKYKRKDKAEETFGSFSDEVFNAYSDYYRKLAKEMVSSFIEYKNDSERFKALKLSRV